MTDHAALRNVILLLGLSLLLFPLQRARGQDNAFEDDLPSEARRLLKEFDVDSKTIQANAEKESFALRVGAIKSLDELQTQYTDQKRIDEAVAIRAKIRELRVAHLKARPNPGTLHQFSSQMGKTFYFEVTGNPNGAVWGTDVYTSDSSLATAAVHAGILKAGQRGLVRVTIVKSPERHQGTLKNGITSADWGQFAASYKVRRPLASDTNVDSNDLPPTP